MCADKTERYLEVELLIGMPLPGNLSVTLTFEPMTLKCHQRH